MFCPKDYVVMAVGASIVIGVLLEGGAQTPPTSPPPLPTSTVSTNETGGFILAVPAVTLEWQLTFTWYPDTGFTNGVDYPISIQVPFKHDKGFVKVNARQREVK